MSKKNTLTLIFYQNYSYMPKMTVITSKTIETNKYIHYFTMKVIEFYAVRVTKSGITVESDRNLGLN